ncbi:MAG TPA: hypothetical protein VF796_24785 [Humisphaera sp.]
MNRRTLLALLAALAVATFAPAARAAELTEDQQAAKTVFENLMFDAGEKLQQLKTGELKLQWKEYDADQIQPLKKALADCKAAKLPGDTKLEIGGKETTFAKAAERAATIEAAFRAAFDQKDDKVATFKNGQTPETLKRYEAFRAAMVAGLTGDKLRIMEQEVLIEAVVYQDPPKFIRGYYGEGKRLLTKPADFAEAKIWVTADHAYASDDTLKRDPHWRVHVYHFDGMKLTHETAERGPGTEAPAKYYQVDGK